MVAQHERQMENSTSAPLPIDILLDIFARLPLSDIASLRRVRQLYLTTREILLIIVTPRRKDLQKISLPHVSKKHLVPSTSEPGSR